MLFSWARPVGVEALAPRVPSSVVSSIQGPTSAAPVLTPVSPLEVPRRSPLKAASVPTSVSGLYQPVPRSAGAYEQHLKRTRTAQGFLANRPSHLRDPGPVAPVTLGGGAFDLFLPHLLWIPCLNRPSSLWSSINLVLCGIQTGRDLNLRKSVRAQIDQNVVTVLV